MNEKIEHRPVFQHGLAIHLAILVVNFFISGYLLFLALAAPMRGVFILYLIGSIITILPAPFFLYQAFALLRAKYIISRNGIGIQWGLRTEDIPIEGIDWIRLPRDFVNPITPPPFRLPGAILATSTDRDLGLIEYIAAETDNLVLIATREKIFAVSPGNPQAFLNDFHRSAELGSFSPIKKQSSKPHLIFSNLAADRTARAILLPGLILSLILLVAVSFIIPNISTVPLGLESVVSSQEDSPSERLILLPLLSLLVFFADIGYGAYLYRKKGFRNAAYIVFFSSLFLPISFTVLVITILFL